MKLFLLCPGKSGKKEASEAKYLNWKKDMILKITILEFLNKREREDHSALIIDDSVVIISTDHYKPSP